MFAILSGASSCEPIDERSTQGIREAPTAVNRPHKAEGKAKVHQFLASEAAKIWASVGPEKDFADTVGSFDALPDEPATDGWKKGKCLLDGAAEEDTQNHSEGPDGVQECGKDLTGDWVSDAWMKPFCFHFWNPDRLSCEQDYPGGYGPEWNCGCILNPPLVNTLPRTWGSSYNRAWFLFQKALELYKNPADRPEAYYWLGHVAHLVTDMCVPAHVNIDPHVPWVNEDEFEEFAGNHFSNYKMAPADEPYLWENLYLPNDIDTPGHDLFVLAWYVAQKTQFWASDDRNGNRKYQPREGGLKDLPDLWAGDEVDPVTLEKDLPWESGFTPHAVVLMRHARKTVAGLYRLFWMRNHTEQCTSAGDAECLDEHSFRRCLDGMNDKLRWGDPEHCPAAQAWCKDGKCVDVEICQDAQEKGGCQGSILVTCSQGAIGTYVNKDCKALGMICGLDPATGRYACIEGTIMPVDPPVDPSEPPAQEVVIPLEKCSVNQAFGAWGNGGLHMGVDLQAKPDDLVLSPARGVVKETRWHEGYGGTVVIQHEAGGEVFTSILGHLRCSGPDADYSSGIGCQGMLVAEGASIEAATPVARIAQTGPENGGWGPHLHWGIRKGAYTSSTDLCGWTYGGIGKPTCTIDWLTDHFYNPMDLVSSCTGTAPGGISTGSWSAPGLVAPEDAVSVALGQVPFEWKGGPPGSKYLTLRNIDTCEKVPGLDKKAVTGTKVSVPLEVPGNYRWTVLSEHEGCPEGVCIAPPRTFYACRAPITLLPGDGAEVPAGKVLFSWTPGDGDMPHWIRVRDVTLGEDGPVQEYPAEGGQADVLLDHPGRYRWVAFYPVEHCTDRSGCDCQQKTEIRCLSGVRTFEVTSAGKPAFSLAVQVVKPSAGADVPSESQVAIEWKSSVQGTSVSHVHVALIGAQGGCDAGSGLVQSISMTPVDGGDPGTASWKVPKGFPAGHYRIRVTAWSGEGFSATACSGAFTILGCQPSCEGRECGADGCNGDCGICPYPKSCSDQGLCACTGASCKKDETLCLDSQAVQQCVLQDGCLTWELTHYCSTGHACVQGKCLCAPRCQGKQCGPDGCGGSCGSCPDGQHCRFGTCVTLCIPDCTGRICGDNGCGGNCGLCSVGYSCADGLCKPDCIPNCVGRSCGDDGCGGSCGVCPDTCSYCKGGACRPVPDKCDDKNQCTVDACSQGKCTNSPRGGGCNDGDACTLGDHCESEACVATYVLTCDDGNPCTKDFCHWKTGCGHVPDAIVCDDGNQCTHGDSCVDGWCVGTAASPCDDGDTCTVDVCYPSKGCVHTPVVRPCDDGDPCTTGDSCNQGACRPGGTVGCDDSNPCTTDICLSWVGCQHVPAGKPCDDGNVCTTGDLCLGGACHGSSMDCDDGNPCTLDACSPGELQDPCIHVPVASACSDGDPCTLGDACVEGTCVPGRPDCDDRIPCTRDTCKGLDGCLHEPDDSLCGPPPVCRNAGICDPLGGCAYDPSPGPCDDGDPCTLDDLCTAGSCKGTPMDCPSGSACRGGKCIPCVEGSAFCDETFLVLCSGGKFVSVDCQATGGVCGGDGAGGFSCLSLGTEVAEGVLEGAVPDSPVDDAKSSSSGSRSCASTSGSDRRDWPFLVLGLMVLMALVVRRRT